MWIAIACAAADAQTPRASERSAAPNAPPLAAASSSSLAEQIAAILAAPDVARDHWGIQVTTLDGTPLYSLNEAQLFQPASNAKLFTTAAALALLGPSRTTETNVTAVGKIAGTHLDGDVVLEGHGDAYLSGRQVPYQATSPGTEPMRAGAAVEPDPLQPLAELADKVAASGIRSISGSVIGDDRDFAWEPYAAGWEVDDTVWGYGAPVSALSINDNQIQLMVAPGANQGDPANVSLRPNVPYYTVDTGGGLQTGAPRSADDVHVERTLGSRVVRVYGTVAVGSAPSVEEIAIDDPAEYAAAAFKQMLQVRGITVAGSAHASHRDLVASRSFLDEIHQPIRPESLALPHVCDIFFTGPTVPTRVLATHVSPPLAQDVAVTNKLSVNIHAELLLRRSGNPDLCFMGGGLASGAQVERAWVTKFAGIDPNDFIFYDGSGLSTHDLVTPRAVAKLLSYAAHDPMTGQAQPWFEVWRSSLPVGGVDGTLADRFTQPPLKGHVYAKTGTLGEARALSGYLDAASGRTVIFSILVGDHLPGTSDDRVAMDKIVAAIQVAE